MDVAKWYYARLKVNEIKECKIINSYHRVCKQNNPVHISQLHKECEVAMLQSVRMILSSCSHRIAQINQTIWTQCYSSRCFNGYQVVLPEQCKCAEQQHQEEPPPAKLHKHDSEQPRTIFNSTHKPEHTTLSRPITTRTTVFKERDNSIQPTPRQLDYSAWNFAHRTKHRTKQWT